MPQQLAGLVFFFHDVVNFKIKNKLQFTDFKTHRLNRRCWFNGLGICEGTAFEKLKPNLAQKFHSSTTVELTTSAVLLQIPC